MKLYCVLFMFFLCLSKSISAEINALELLATCESTIVTAEVALQRAPTSNGFGYIFYTISPLAQAFIDGATTTKRFFEAGAGFSNITEQCLRKGILEYTANDLSLEHLKMLAVRLAKTFGEQTAHTLQPLYFLPGKVPNVLPDKVDYYDAILVDKMMHFLTPQEADDFLNWASKALKKGGKLFIFTASIYCKTFCTNELITMRDKNQEQYNFYAGFAAQVDKLLNYKKSDHPGYSLPPSMLFFKQSDLLGLLAGKQFHIEQSMAFKLPRPEHPFWTPAQEPDCDLIGVIAQKMN